MAFTTAPLQRAVHYEISLSDAAVNLVDVKVTVGPGSSSERDLQLPVWNALYQVRDFAQYVGDVEAHDSSGKPLVIRKVDKSRWQVRGAPGGFKVEYQILANLPGPYGAQLNPHHAFFNLAEILMYPVDDRLSPQQITFTNVPSGWRVATSLKEASAGARNLQGFSYEAHDYDALVDSPVELGSFKESDFDDEGGHYRVVVDADPADYDMRKVVEKIHRIVTAETHWMNDRPFDTYLFIYHFPRGSGGGGMEHAFGTAIDVDSSVLAEDPQTLADVTAHEFFHLWNVKRIRPQSLEPIDYTKENYTTSLWFSEGFTNTVGPYILLRAGLLDESSYLKGLAQDIGVFERRPAHTRQSAEESSLNAWLEKYPAYRQPERSVSYYNKGELIGMVLDLALREATNNASSLRDLFQWMNQHYARQGRFFLDSAGVLDAVEQVGHTNFKPFFNHYVSGTDEIPWNDFFKTVGLELVRRRNVVANLGFTASRGFGSFPQVVSIDPGSGAKRAGLKVGDTIGEINGEVASSNFEQRLRQLPADSVLRLRVRNAAGETEIQWKLAPLEEEEYSFRDLSNITPQQKARRLSWLHGEPQNSGAESP
ncbi:MAG: hypothetical protein JOY93_01445 [Acidobacteriales bacterium]|nr:hypothetical protein [Terriglobales bacterium]